MSSQVEPIDSIPAYPGHCKNKWTQRSDVKSIGIDTAWFESVPIGIPEDCPWGPRARLHDPGNVVLIYTHADEPNKEWVIKTVLHVPLKGGDYELVDDHLVTCEDCGYRYDPGRKHSDGCHWCEHGY